MSRVYGDSTPFPHDIDYIHLLRDAIDCAVRLLSAQHSMRVAEQRAEAAERAKQLEVAELNALFEHVQAATARAITGGHDLTVRTAGQVVAGTRNVVEAAVTELEAQVGVEVGQARHIMDKARETGSSAVEKFLADHAPPGSRLALQLLAGPESYVGHVTLITSYGVSAVFGVAVPPSHLWARARRVGDFSPNVEVHMPKESGWLSKRTEMAPVRLERLFISDVMYSERSGVLRLRRAMGSGPGYQLRVDSEAGLHTSISRVNDDGSVDEEHPLPLEGKDQATMLGLWQLVVDSSRELLALRQRMVSGAFADRPLLELDSPRALAEALIKDMAPTAVEISRRSGAPGELVLRRNLGEGRREETYSTHSELVEKIMVLPPELRAVFAPLELSGVVGSAPPAQRRPILPELEPRAESSASRLPAPSNVHAAGLDADLRMAQVANGAAIAPPNRPPSVPPPEGTPAVG